jgi:hypothetical protein
MIGAIRQWLQRAASARRMTTKSAAELRLALTVDTMTRAESARAAARARQCAAEARDVIAEATAQAERRLHGQS